MHTGFLRLQLLFLHPLLLKLLLFLLSGVSCHFQHKYEQEVECCSTPLQPTSSIPTPSTGATRPRLQINNFNRSCDRMIFLAPIFDLQSPQLVTPPTKISTHI